MEQPKQSFFQRHPGFDAYSLFWLVLFLILAALGRFFLPLLHPGGGGAGVPALPPAVQEPGEAADGKRPFLCPLPVDRPLEAGPQRGYKTDKVYYYFKCPTCGQSMRVPRGLGKIEVTCKACSSRFEVRS